MGRKWKDSRLVGSVPRDSDNADPFGFGIRAGKTTCKGAIQAFLSGGDFEEADPNDQTLVLGVDKRVYEERKGLIECLVPAILTSDEPKVYVEGIDWKSFPLPSDLARLFKAFFSRYTDREVLMLVGKKRNEPGWLYLVPEQVGSCGSVEWTSGDKEMGWFQERAKWVGTIHSHPGNCCQPSQTDIDDWAEPEKSGLHLVFGRDGSFTINGAIAGKTFEVDRGTVSDIVGRVNQQPIEYWLSRGRSLEKLLKKPKPIVARTVSRGKINMISVSSLCDTETNQPICDDNLTSKSREVWDFVKASLDVVGALPLLDRDAEDVPILRIVQHGGRLFALTLHQYTELTEWCKDTCPVPESRKLRLHGIRGGV